MNSELNVRSTGLDTDLTDDCERGVAHHLVLFVCERLHRCDGDGIAGVHTHWIEIFDGTNDHAVVHPVAHDFHLKFFPAHERFFDQNFTHWRKIEAACGNDIEFLAVVSDPATGPAQSECGANDQRKFSDLSDDAVKIRK